jgi:hypothetical protein
MVMPRPGDGSSRTALPVGSFAARERAVTYAVQLRLDDIRRAVGTAYDSACSAVLISRTWIMAAGHCFHDGNRVRVGGAPRYASTARLGTVSTADPRAGVTWKVVWVEQSPTSDIAVPDWTHRWTRSCRPGWPPPRHPWDRS